MSDNTALQQESPVRIIENSPTPVEIAAPSNTDHITADQPLNSTENNTTAAEDTVASELPQDTTPKCEQDKSDTEKAQFEKDDANKAPNSNDLGLSEETEAKPATESSTSDSATKKTTLSKRRTLFNPFFKSKKEDQSPKKEETSAPAEPSQEELDASDSTENASEAPAAPEKKKSKGFASLFSRSKSTPKAAQSTHSSPAVEDDTASTTTELPPIEQFQPIETEAVVNECKDDVPQVVTPENHDQVQVETSEAKKDEPNTESEQIKPAEASDEQGEVATSSPATEEDKPVTTMQPQKRQSFISKLFGKKKHPKEEKPEPVIKEEPKEETKQYKQEEIEDSDASSGPVEPETIIIEQVAVDESKKELSRPSSPLGRRLTDLLSKIPSGKKDKSSSKATTDSDVSGTSTPEPETIQLEVAEEVIIVNETNNERQEKKDVDALKEEEVKDEAVAIADQPSLSATVAASA